MFEKILVPTDFSKYSQKVLECVSEIPGVTDVALLHVIDATDPLARVWDPGARVNDAKAELEKQEKYLKALGLNATSKAEVITGGDIPSAIQRNAEIEKASLVVMGARGKSRIEGVFLGSVARDVVRHGRTDVLIMRYKLLEGEDGPSFENFCPVLFSKVLCTTDFSKASEAAVSKVKTLEGVKEVVLMHVVTKGESEEAIEADITEATKKLHKVAEDLSRPGLTVKVSVDTGHAATKISQAAEKEDASLIVMSSHGKGWLQQLMVGSTAYDVVRMVNRPVLVVRAKEKA